MGFIIGLIKKLIKLTLVLAVLAVVIVLIPNLPPYTKFSTIVLEPTQAREGPLAPNEVLNNAQKGYENKILGPEAFELYNGELYTGLFTGEVVKLSPGGHVTFVTKIGQPCSSVTEMEKCGRPLGIAIDEKTKQLYVADAYYGIWRVALGTDKKQLLVSPRVAIEGREPKIFNGLALAKNGDIYYTDSSSDYTLNDGVYATFSDPSGRLLHYNAAKNKSKVLIDDLWLANGVAVSPDNQFVLVTESFKYRILKYYIDGPKKGKSEVFVAGLPGAPDNMRALPDGSGVLVALYVSFDAAQPLLARSLAAAPLARKLIARLHRLVEIPFEFLHKQFPNEIFADIVFRIGHFSSLSGLMPTLTGLVQLDWNGNIVASYYNTDGSMNHISDAVVFNDKLLTGNPNFQNYVGSVAVPPLLKKAFASNKATPQPQAESVKKEVPKPKVEVKQEKPVESPKPKEQAKPVSQPPKEPPKPKEQAKPVSQPPKEPPKQEQIKVSTPKPVEKKPATPAPQPTQPPMKEEAGPTTAKPPATEPVPKEKKKPIPFKLVKTADNVLHARIENAEHIPYVKLHRSEEIPITEEIPSDTKKPDSLLLKVIKKTGPTEIPNPSV